MVCRETQRIAKVATEPAISPPAAQNQTIFRYLFAAKTSWPMIQRIYERIYKTNWKHCFFFFYCENTLQNGRQSSNFVQQGVYI